MITRKTTITFRIDNNHMYICKHFSVYIAVDNLATASESLKYSEHNGARLLLGYLERTNISEIETFIFQT